MPTDAAAARSREGQHDGHRQIEDAYLVKVFSPVSLVSAYRVESTRCQT